LNVRYVYSTDAAPFLDPLVTRFNSESHRIGAHQIEIEGIPLASGEAESALARRVVRPALWTPASSLWTRLLKHDVGRAWTPPTSPSLVSSPQVIAMWEPLARALGWPRKKVGWHDVLALATSTRGWAAFGHPEFGPFRLGHTNPDISTSGLSAVLSEYYALTGKRSGLGLDDIAAAGTRARVRTIERAIVHYGKTANAFTSQMDAYGQAYAHAVYVQESSLRAFNATRKQASRLVGIVPAEGTFVADYPLVVMRAPWVDAQTRAAAAAFGSWLRAHLTVAVAERAGFRLRRPAGILQLELPAPDVHAAVRDGWRRDRKPANIVLVVDSSSSMGGAGRLDAAKTGLLSFLGQLSPQDRVSLVTSGTAVSIRVPLGSPARSKPLVADAVRDLFPNGELPVYPAIRKALAAVRALRDPGRINAVVVLSDGAGASTGYDALLRDIRSRPVTEGTSVRIFSVAYGDDADAAALKRIAAASGGAFYPSAPRDIKDVYRTIAAYF
jgi:Ca-activated chloride channel family protein